MDRSTGWQVASRPLRTALLGLCAVLLTLGGVVAPAVTAHAATWVGTENARPGTTDWYLDAAATADPAKLAGYTTKTSALPGDRVVLKIDNRVSDTQRVSVYRLGWYQGTGGRLVTQTGWVAAQRQPTASLVRTDAYGTTINKVDASSWTPSVSLDSTGWLPGVYMFVVEATTGDRTLIPFTLRSPSFAGKTILVTAPATWQAYNRYGGYSAYYGPDPANPAYLNPAYRSRQISFDRPLDRQFGVDHFLVMERSLIAEAERLGTADLAYTTGEDLDAEGSAKIAGSVAVVTLGHDEYWSNGHRAALAGARDAGTNLLFAGGNTLWWRIRYGDNWRSFAIYKSATEDPTKSLDQATVTFTDAQIISLLGSRYSCAGVAAPMVITDPAFFLFRGTGVIKGQKISGMARIEVDSVVDSAANPANLSIAAHSPFTCDGMSRWADLTYYTAASGAGVVNLSSMGFAVALDPYHRDQYPMPDASIAFARRVYTNALATAAAGPLGRSYPPSGNANDVLAASGLLGPSNYNPPVDEPAHGSKVFGDLTGDGIPDVLAVRSTGELFLYQGTRSGTVQSGRQVGSGWTRMLWIGKVPDLNADGTTELVARRDDGTVWLYPGKVGGYWGAGVQVASGWGSITASAVSSDVTGDGRPELLARHVDGRLLRYRFTSVSAPLGGGEQVGHGWQSMRALLVVTDFSKDGVDDLMAIRDDGVMFAYTAGPGYFTSVGQVGHGWTQFLIPAVPGDFDGDGRLDMIGVRSDGNLYFYRNLSIWWDPAKQIGANWQAMRILA